MGIFKAIKVEVTILAEPGVEDDEVVKWIEDGCLEYEPFKEAVAVVVESYDNVLMLDTIKADAN